MIMQYGWLDFDGGSWILITNIPNNVERKWMDESEALTELTKEGWTISDPYPYEPEKFYGYVMSRMVH